MPLLQAIIAARGPRPACIKLKFTTNGRGADVEDGKMVNRGSDPRSSLTPRPLHPFTCLVGNDDRPESFKLKPASEPLRAYQFARDAAEKLPWLEVNRARRGGRLSAGVFW